MNTSPNGIAVMHYFEDCRLKAYPDPATGGAPWTIGWGDTGPDVVPGLIITQAEADRRFARRLAREFEPGVLAELKRTPTQSQFDAMVCLAYNIGLGNFRASTLVRMFNRRELGVANQFLRWDRAAQRRMLGLHRRRVAERALYLGASAEDAIKAGAAVRALPVLP
jgi:lysozyme